MFTRGMPVDVTGRLTIPLRRPGTALDFTLADFDMPVVRTDLGRDLAALCGDQVQLIPADVESENEQYSILNITRALACLDDARSGVTYWTEPDGRPDKVGEYRMVLNPHVDPARIHAEHIFRIAGWKIAMIVSEEARSVLGGATGAVFEPA